LEFGADEYTAKPFGVRELIACVEAALRRKESQTESIKTFDDGRVYQFRRPLLAVGSSGAEAHSQGIQSPPTARPDLRSDIIPVSKKGHFPGIFGRRAQSMQVKAIERNL
jgi:hypothetical protein